MDGEEGTMYPPGAWSEKNTLGQIRLNGIAELDYKICFKFVGNNATVHVGAIFEQRNLGTLNCD